MEETILTRHPEGKQGVRILKRRYDAVKSAIIDTISRKGEITFKDLNGEVAGRLQPEFDGSIPWYVVTVKLDLEARGLVERIPGVAPQALRIGRLDEEPDVESRHGHEFREAMAMLEELGTAQNRKVYAAHGSPDPMFGVSIASLRDAAKKLGKNKDLAAALWDSRNFDAMALATLIDDPEAITSTELDTRVKDVHYYHLADFFSTFVSKTKFAAQKMNQWTQSDEEYVRRCGYTLVSALAKNVALMDDGTLADYISAIEEEIHTSPNRAREAMNKALIDIGRRRSLKDAAYDAAQRIGFVYVDHGETGCKTPDAVAELGRYR